MEQASEMVLFSTDPDTKGFDLSAGERWIYPENYPPREYQYNIVNTALYNNTLVCLPTGLGKTFIAAVVMYNFWRWYPQGKVVFLAPTKPLVAQQIHACHDIMGIPSVETIELTGSMNPKNRQIAWLRKRVIFATPQVFQNDLEKSIAPGEFVRCVVIDEAHKALGKHSYCESLRILRMQNKCFRVLALSATPGGKIDDVHQVIRNLYISNLELRDETSKDIVPYLNKRKMDIFLVPLGDNLTKFKEKYIQIMDHHVRLLVRYNILKGDAGNISKGRIFHIYREFQNKTNKGVNYNQIMHTLNICLTMYHAYELMIRHGLRAFYNFYQNHSDKYWRKNELQLQELLEEVEKQLGHFPNVDPLPDGSIPEIPNDVKFGHTKFYKLKQLLLQHFKSFEAKKLDTRAIVFVEYRDSVNEVYVLLLQARPLLRPQMFVGQSGQRQKQQLQAMKDFRSNKANILISTSVGEEGLDVGEVDLIVCFDISQRSPIRLVQRMGRTGRKRDGRIIMLVTDGKEHQTLKSTINRRDSMNNKVLQSSNIVSSLYQEDLRMVPPQFQPECYKMHISVQPKTPARKGKKESKKVVASPSKEKKKAGSKGKNTTSATTTENSKTKSSQSTMMKFLIKTSPNKAAKEPSPSISQDFRVGPCTPMTPNRAPDNIRLLTSDSAAVEFLTLCAIRKSKQEELYNESDKLDMTYFPSPPHDDVDNFFDLPVPDLDVLDCLKSMKKNETLLSPETSDDDSNNMIGNDYWEIDHNRSILTCKATKDVDSAVAEDSHFEDLLNDSFVFDEDQFSDKKEDLKSNEDLGSSMFEHLLNEDSNLSAAPLVNKDAGNDALQKEDDMNELDKPGLFETLIDESSDDNAEEIHHKSGSESDIFEDPLNKSSNAEEALMKQSETDVPGTSNFFEDLLEDSSDNSDANDELPVVDTEQLHLPSTSYCSRTENQSRTCKAISDSIILPPAPQSSDVKKGFVPKTVDNIARNRNVNDMATKTTERFHDTSNAIKLNHLPTSCKAGGDKISPFFASKRSSSSALESFFSTKSIKLEKLKGKQCEDSFNHRNNIRPSEEKEASVPMKMKTDKWEDMKINEFQNRSSSSALESFFSTKSTKSEKLKSKQCKDSFNNGNNIRASEEKKASVPTKMKTDKWEDMKINEFEKSSDFNDDSNMFKVHKKHSDSTEKERRKTDNDTRNNDSMFSVTQMIDLLAASKPSTMNTNINRTHQDASASTPLKIPISQQNTQKDSEFARKTGNPVANDNSRSQYFCEKICEQSSEDDIFAIEDSPKADEDLTEFQWDDDFQEGRNVISLDDSFDLTPKSKPKITDTEPIDFIDLTDIDWEDDVIGEEQKIQSNAASKVSKENDVKQASPIRSLAFDLGDYEWDSDFETPSNPAASLQQFGKSSSVSGDNKCPIERKSEFSTSSRSAQGGNTAGSLLKSPSVLGKFSARPKQRLSLNKSPISKPSTSKQLDSDDEFMPVIKCAKGKDNDSKACYVLTSNSPNLNKLKRPELPLKGKENRLLTSPVNRFSSFSAPAKYKSKMQEESNPKKRDKICSSLGGYPGKRKKHYRKKIRSRIRSEFIDSEAEASSGTTEGSSGSDGDLEGFVSNTQEIPETVDMQAHYLQSMRSPLNKPGVFCFKEPKTPRPDIEVFSQPQTLEDNSSYLYDSFCVEAVEDDDVQQSQNYSLLEQAEKALRNRKRKQSRADSSGRSKKRKAVGRISNSSSSEDETEKLRRQILAESMLLRNGKS